MARNRAIITPWHFLMLAFLTGTVLGTVMANACRISQMPGVQLFLEAAGQEAAGPGAGASGGGSELILVAGRRLLETAFCWALGQAGCSIPGFAAVSLYLGISSSMILSAMTMERGFMGLLIYLAAQFPQGLIYAPVFLVTAFWGLSGEKKPHRAAFVLLLLASAVGAVLETLVNPWILGIVL